MNTAQEIFDYVVSNLINQGCKSIGAFEDTCRYRGINGTKCAAGWLIPDELYNTDMENRRIIAIPKGWLPPAINNNFGLVTELQNAHDTSSVRQFVAGFKANARRIADRYNLTWNFN